MKIYNQAGSKQRFLEMFQGVNKMKLNEAVISADNTLVTKSSILTNAFDELKNGALQIKQTNSQSDNNENHVEVSGADDAGNELTFRFRTTTSQGEQDGVFSVDSAEITEFIFRNNSYNVEIAEGDKILQQFNAQRAQEIVDVVSEYSDDNSGEAPDAEQGLYEDAVNLIDRIPYKKGTEDMQTNKAYADQKPTNPALRVQSDELQKYLSEVQDYVEDDTEDTDDSYTTDVPEEDALALPPDYDPSDLPKETDDDGSIGVDPNTQVGVSDEPVEDVSPEKKEIIFKAYDNLVATGNREPTLEQIMLEVDKIEGNVKPVQKVRGIPKGAEPFWEGAEVDSAEVDGIKVTDVVKGGFDNLLSKEKKGQLIFKAAKYVDSTLGDLKNTIPQEIYVKNVRNAAIRMYKDNMAEMNETEYPKEMEIGKEFKTKSKYPKPKKHRPKRVTSVDESELTPEENPELTDAPVASVPKGEMDGANDPKNYDINQNEVPDEVGNELEGGKGDDKSPADFDLKQIKLGIEVEKEHTDDPFDALEIVLDHLTEDPEYYTVKDDPEASAQFNAASDASGDEPHSSGAYVQDGMAGERDRNGNPIPAIEPNWSKMGMGMSDDKDMTDMLLGYEPKNVGDVDEEFNYADAEVGYDNNDSYQKYLKYTEMDFNNLSDQEKEEFFMLWKEFKGAEPVQEEIGHEEYKGAMGDKYADAEGNEFSVANKVNGGVSLRGQGGEKEVATGDLTLMKKLGESKESKQVITEELIKVAKNALNKRGGTSMAKKEAVRLLILHNVKH